MSCEHTTFSLVFVNMPTGKRLRAQTKEAVVNVYEYFEELSRCKRTEESLKRTSDATKLSRTRIKRLRKEKLSTYLNLPSLLKVFFQNHGGFIAASNHKRRYLVIILIIIVIIYHLFI